MSSECPVCFEFLKPDVVLSPLFPVTCPACIKPSCITCVKAYALQTGVPKCTICSMEFSMQFARTVMSSNFMNANLKQKREELLLEQQRARLPDTQVHHRCFSLCVSVLIECYFNRRLPLPRSNALN